MASAPSAAPCSSASVSSGSFTPASVSAPPRPPRAAPSRPTPAASPAPSATPARSTSEATSPAGDSPPEGDPDLSRRFIEAIIKAESILDEALAQRGPAKIFTLDGRGLGTLHGRISIGAAASALSKAFERHRETGDEILIRFADQGPALFLTDPGERLGDDATPAGEAGAGEVQVQAGGPFTLDNTTKTRTAQGISPDREAAERAINLLIRKGFAPRLSTYPTAGRGPVHNMLLPTSENLDLVLDANRQGSSVGILIHAVREDLEPGKAPKAADLSPRGILLDLDGPQGDGTPWTAEAILERLPMRPALVVETSAGRHHALIGPLGGLDLESFRKAGKALAARFAGSDAVLSPTKTLRLPGSLNLKDSAHPFLVRAVGGDGR